MTGQTLYSVAYRDEAGKVRALRCLARNGDEAAKHARGAVVGFITLERVIVVRNDPFNIPQAAYDAAEARAGAIDAGVAGSDGEA